MWIQVEWDALSFYKHSVRPFVIDYLYYSNIDENTFFSKTISALINI